MTRRFSIQTSITSLTISWLSICAASNDDDADNQVSWPDFLLMRSNSSLREVKDARRVRTMAPSPGLNPVQFVISRTLLYPSYFALERLMTPERRRRP